MTTRFLYVSRPFNFGYILSLNAEQAATADSACHSSVSYVSGASPEIGSDSDMHVDEPQSPWRVANYAVVDSNVAKEILSPPSTQSSTDSMECSNQVIDRPISPLLTESSSVGATSLPVPSVTSASNPDEQSRSSSPPPGREDTAAASPAQADSTRSAPVAEPSSRPHSPAVSTSIPRTSPVDVTLTPNHGPERTSRRRQRQHNYAGYQIRMARRQTRHAQNEPAESANGLSLASRLSEPRQPTGSHYGQSRHHNHQVGPRDSRLPRSSSHRR